MSLISRAALTLGAGVTLFLTAGASAQTYHWAMILSGPLENPPNASPGTGFGTVDWDLTAHTMHLHVDFSGLTGTTTASHIHAASSMVPVTGVAGVATTTPSFAGFPLGVTAGTFDNTLNMLSATSYNASFISGNGGTPASAEVALFNLFMSSQAYWNIHSSTFGGGEIRGILPTPGAAAVLGLGGLMISRRRR